MQVNDLLGQGKADAGFSAPPHVEAVKDVGKIFLGDAVRSEERRVGKECRSRWSPYH